MKKYLFIALAALGFAACAEKMDDNSPVQKGELEESYIAINLMSADVDTRAPGDPLFPDDTYERGTDAERAIKSAYFFFFDAEGNAFNVNATANNPATSPGDVNGVNHLSLQISEATTAGMPNVSDIKNAVLILNTYKGVYPSKIVAVLNWIPDANTAYDLDKLHEMLETIGNDTKGYVMSNSVYMDGAGNVVDAVPLTAANIKTTEAEALATPIDIYVERTAAKVVLTANRKVSGTDNIFDTQKNSTPVLGAGTSSDIDVYVKLHGWELYNDYSTSTLLKNIENWNVGTLGLTWNDIPYYRCYWAESQNADPNDSFSWKYTTEGQSSKGFTSEYGFNVGGSTYCGENTNPVDGHSTKVILKGQLMQKNGENYEPLELARWYGTEYAGNEALRIAVANSLKYTLYYKDGDSYISIEPGDLECVAGNSVEVEAYEVFFQLTTAAAKNKTWYQYSSANGYVAFGTIGEGGNNAAKANEYLKEVEPALLYSNGMTYYIVDIKHLGAEDTTAEYGVVRNHVYQIDINSISGYGSPVYNGLSNLETPEYPEVSESSYVAARINVLSWKVVKHQVNVGQ